MLSSNSSDSQPVEYSGPLGSNSSSMSTPWSSKATPAMTSPVRRTVSLRGTAIRRPRATSYSIDSPASDSLTSFVSASSRNSADYDVTSVDDLISEPGPDYIKSNLKSYNKKLITYMMQQGLNLNPLKLKQRKISKGKGLLSMVLRGESRNPNIETFVTSNGQILFIPFNPFKKRCRRHHHNHQHGEGGNSEDDDDYEGQEEEEDGITDDDSSSDEEARGNNGIDEAPLNAYNPISKTITTTTTATELARGHHRHTVTSHTFCVIVKLAKEETLNTVVRASYHADARTKWSQGIPADGKHVKYKEHYRVSNFLDWDLNMDNPDCFIPFKDYDDDSLSMDLNADSESSIASTMKDVVFAEGPTQDVRVFELLAPNELPDEDLSGSKDADTTRNLFEDMNYGNSKTFQPGYYVFLLPVVYPINTPETVLTPIGSVVHKFNVQIDKEPYQPSIQAPQMSMSTPLHHSKFDDALYSVDQATRVRSHTSTEHEQPSSPKRPHSLIKSSFLKKFSIHRQASIKSSSSKLLNGLKPHSTEPTRSFFDFGYNLPVVRLPPSDATSTLNKSIYVNKIWNDALNYELLLPRKYITLSPMYDVNDQFLKSHMFMLQMKLIPLIKGLCLKRIKFNVVEKATYISKDRKYEEDVGDVDRTGVKERVVTLLEIKAKDRPSRGEYPPLCSQVVTGCQNDNLLTCCYKTSTFGNDKKSNSKISHRDKDDIIITNPVKIQCPLTFTANDESKFIKTVHKNLCKGTTDINDLRDSSSEDLDDTNDVLSIFSVNSQSNSGAPDSSIDNCIESSFNANGSSVLKKVKSQSAVEGNEDGNYWVSKSPTLSSVLSPKSRKTFYGLSPPSDALSTLTDDEKRRIYTFFPDVTFHNVKIRHRLQVCFRISKPDPSVLVEGVPKMHHYEVIVDTPIVFVSPFCASDTVELPSYDYAVKSQNFDPPSSQQFDFSQLDRSNSSMEPRLPTFEEAVLQPGSPMMTGLSGEPNAYPGSVDLTTVVSPSPMSTMSASPLSSRMDHGFNNLDSVVDMGSKNTVPNMFFAKQTIRKTSVGTSSKLSAAAHRDGRQNEQKYGSIDSALGVGGNHNPSRSSLVFDTKDLPSYQSVIEEEMSGGLEQKMKLLNVSTDGRSKTQNSLSDADTTATDMENYTESKVPVGDNKINDSNGDDTGSWSTLNSLERAHARHVV
ncbi:hypothetical protein HII12_000483 [Brettanomyces bruxellensis]|uniref:Arrestin C-terminal-like domain-containing protein n=1 Tax=Dekkera bruxellensis TaxID=5007 RepID=A0A8H6BQ51_DEKBR|nr:hypothetical protein HII12_000483 [Brettanomyces bruxellensis]